MTLGCKYINSSVWIVVGFQNEYISNKFFFFLVTESKQTVMVPHDYGPFQVNFFVIREDHNMFSQIYKIHVTFMR